MLRVVCNTWSSAQHALRHPVQAFSILLLQQCFHKNRHCTINPRAVTASGRRRTPACRQVASQSHWNLLTSARLWQRQSPDHPAYSRPP